MLAVAGDLLEDVVVLLREPPRRGADAAADIRRRPGGSAANVAAAAADLGHPVRLLTRVGDDATGRSLVASLRRRGVEVVAEFDGRTGAVVVIVEPDGQRTMYPDRAASAGLRLDPAALTGVEVLHVTGYSLAPQPAQAPLVRQLEGLGLPISVDVSSLQVIEQLGPALPDLLRHLQPIVVFANADEAAALGWGERRRPEGLTVVVKRGPEPALVLTGPAAVPVPAVADPARVVDTTGAGDAFAAGYLGAVLAGHDPVQATSAGHRSAARHLLGLAG